MTVCGQINTQKTCPGCIYVNSALAYHLHSSHLQFSTPLPPPPQFTPPVLHPSSPTSTVHTSSSPPLSPSPTVHLLRRLYALDTVNNFEILNIKILISLCSSEMLMFSISKLFIVSKASSRWTVGGGRGVDNWRCELWRWGKRGGELEV